MLSSLIWRGLPQPHHRSPGRLRNHSVDPELRQVPHLHEDGGQGQNLGNPDEDQHGGEIGTVGDGGKHDDEGHAKEAERHGEDAGHDGLRAQEEVSAAVAILTVPARCGSFLDWEEI